MHHSTFFPLVISPLIVTHENHMNRKCIGGNNSQQGGLWEMPRGPLLLPTSSISDVTLTQFNGCLKRHQNLRPARGVDHEITGETIPTGQGAVWIFIRNRTMAQESRVQNRFPPCLAPLFRDSLRPRPSTYSVMWLKVK
jgi:hypothetical protein